VSVGIDDKRQGNSLDAALIALAQARDQIGVSNERWRSDRSVEPELKEHAGSKTSGDLAASQSVFGMDPVERAEGAARGGPSTWGLVGLSALVPIAVVILAWHFLYRPADGASVSVSSVSRDLAAKSGAPSPTSPRVPQQKDAAVTSLGSPRLDLDQSMAEMARQLADSTREIDELRTRQSQILLDNSELDRQLKEAQELARSNAGLMKDLKSIQAQMVQENADLAAQVKASQEQVTKLATQLDATQTQIGKIAAQTKASQDQKVRIVEQKPRPKLSTPAHAINPPKQPAPRPRLQQARPQTEDPADAQ
jgi:hypothetical protein